LRIDAARVNLSARQRANKTPPRGGFQLFLPTAALPDCKRRDSSSRHVGRDKVWVSYLALLL
jgi:hypothetical protein